jgi:hypothetical protein
MFARSEFTISLTSNGTHVVHYIVILGPSLLILQANVFKLGQNRQISL